MGNDSHLTAEQLQCYFDNTCGADELQHISDHLRHCTECVNELEKIKAVDILIKSDYRIAPLSVNLSEKVTERVFRKEKSVSFDLNKMLYAAAILISLAGAAYYLILTLQELPLIITPTIIITICLYLWVSYKEIMNIRQML